MQYIKAKDSQSFSNGRYVRNVLERTIRSQSMRLLSEPHLEQYVLTALLSEDLSFPESKL